MGVSGATLAEASATPRDGRRIVSFPYPTSGGQLLARLVSGHGAPFRPGAERGDFLRHDRLEGASCGNLGVE
jgi:hypothetical protein